MSDHETLLGSVFELQRETIKRGADLLQFPRNVRDELSREGLATGEQVGSQLLELSRGSIHQSLTLAESVQGESEPIDDLRETVEEVFDELQERHEHAYETVEQHYEQTETETMTRSAEQLSLLLDLSRSLETQLATAVEHLESQATRSDELEETITEQIDRLSEQLERETERYTELQEQLQENIDLSETDAAAADTVRCQVCGERYGAITDSHLQTHDLTIEEYKDTYGEDAPLR